MKQLTFIENGTLPLLDADSLLQVASILTQRYEHYLSGRQPVRPVQGDRAPLGITLSARGSDFDETSSEEFVVESGYSSEQVQLRVTLCRKDRSWGYPVETVITAAEGQHIDAPDSDIRMKMLGVLMNYQDAYWAEYFASRRETFVTLDWSAERYEGFTVYVRGFERAWDLEAAADRLFAEHGCGNHDIVPVSSET